MTAPLPDVPGYRVLHPVGEAVAGRPAGAVFLAAPLDRPGARVVIKDYLLWADSEPAHRAGAGIRLNRSWLAGTATDHPGIVRPVARLGGRWLVLAWIDGPSLSARLRQAPLPRAEAWAIVLAIAEALAALTAGLDRRFPERPGMGHGDLQAQNVLLPAGSAPGTVRIIDLDRVGQPLKPYRPLPEHRRGQILRAGQAVSVPPEVCFGDIPYADSRADVFALGVLAWRLLTGGYPFASREEYLAKLDRLVAGGPAADGDLVPARIHAARASPATLALARMTQLDRSARPPSMAAALELLRRVRGG